MRTPASVDSSATVSPHEGHPAGSPEHRKVVGALFAAGVATFVLLYSTQALFPELAADFGVSSAASTLSLSVATASLGLALLVLGPLSDRFGRTRIVNVSVAASAVVALACALAPTWHALLGLRALQGVALAGLPAVATAYLREELHASTHARAAGVYVGGTAIGGMAGRLVTGPVAEVAGWRWALAAAAGVGLVCAVVVRLLLPASRRFVPVPAGTRSVLARTRRALADPALLALYALGACAVGAFTAVFNSLGFRVEGAPFNLGLGAASLLFLVYPLGSVGSAASGWVADRVGRRAVVPGGALLALAGLALTLTDRLPLVVAGVGVLTAGFFVVHGTASGWVPARAHAGGVATGQAASFYLFSYYVGASVFGGASGRVWSAAGWPGVVALSAVLLLACGALAIALRHIPALAPTRTSQVRREVDRGTPLAAR